MNAGGGPDKSPAACNAGVGAGDLHYSFMGDLPLEQCQAKCEELNCPCFDYAGPNAKATVRTGEHCRVCASGKLAVPLRHSGWGYQAVLRTDSDWGSTFLTVVVGLAALYFGAGYVYNSRTGGTTGIHALPHARYWVELHGLFSDGVAYARNGGHSGYRSVEGARPKPDLSAEKSKKSKESPTQEKTSKGSGKRKEKRSSKEQSGTADTSTPAATAAPAAAGTVAAGGGRWVHVPT